MNEDNKAKVILITGCSSGFGLLMAARFASKGHKVIATMRDTNKQGALLSEVNRRGGSVKVVPLDVTDKNSIEQAILEIVNSYDRVDVLINNAGYGIGGAFEDLTDEEIRAQMETNFFGVQNVTRKVIPFMRRQKSGTIINISSVAGFSTSPLFSAYNCSKWALEAFSESLRYELKFFGINVCLIEPGTYKTKIFFENRKVAKHFDNENSPYYEISQHLMDKVMGFVHDCHKDPEEIGVLAEKLMNAKNPRFRNVPDIESKVLYFLRKFLPFRMYSWMIRSACFKGFKNTAIKKQQTVSTQ